MLLAPLQFFCGGWGLHIFNSFCAFHCEIYSLKYLTAQYKIVASNVETLFELDIIVHGMHLVPVRTSLTSYPNYHIQKNLYESSIGDHE